MSDHLHAYNLAMREAHTLHYQALVVITSAYDQAIANAERARVQGVRTANQLLAERRAAAERAYEQATGHDTDEPPF